MKTTATTTHHLAGATLIKIIEKYKNTKTQKTTNTLPPRRTTWLEQCEAKSISETQKNQIHTSIYREMKTTATTTYHLDGATLKKQNKKYNNTQNTKIQNASKITYTVSRTVTTMYHLDGVKNYSSNTYNQTKYHKNIQTSEKYKHIK